GALAKVSTGAAASSATNPFLGAANTKLDFGPVGPALNYQTYAATVKDLYFGNWGATGDLVKFANGVGPTAVANYVGTGRITALAFERRPQVVVSTTSPPIWTAHSTLYVGHGTTVSIVDVDNNPVSQIDVDLANPNIFTPNLHGYGDATVTLIRSISVHP